MYIKVNTVSLMILFIIFASVFVVSILIARNTIPGVGKTYEVLPGKQYTICVGSGSSSPFTQNTIRGFAETLSKSKNASYSIKKYNANLNRTLMRSQMEEIVQVEPDLIFTTGMGCSKLAKEITEKRKKLIPIVFCGVPNPIEAGLIASEENSGNHITGVYALAMPLSEQINCFLKIKPTMKQALILCNYSDVIKNDVLKIKEQLHLRNIKAKEIAVYGMSEVIQKISPFLADPSYDTLFCLRDGISISVMDSLVKLCNRHNVTLFSTYLDAAAKGAAFSLGIFEQDFGAKSAELVMKILEEGFRPTQLPIVKFGSDGYQLHINNKTAELQGLHIDPTLRFFINNAKII